MWSDLIAAVGKLAVGHAVVFISQNDLGAEVVGVVLDLVVQSIHNQT